MSCDIGLRFSQQVQRARIGGDGCTRTGRNEPRSHFARNNSFLYDHGCKEQEGNFFGPLGHFLVVMRRPPLLRMCCLLFLHVSIVLKYLKYTTAASGGQSEKVRCCAQVLGLGCLGDVGHY